MSTAAKVIEVLPLSSPVVDPSTATRRYDVEPLLQESGESTLRSADVAASSALRAPTLPGYELVKELGRGGMGVVYKARHKKLNRIVALKMVLAGGKASEEDRARFRAEAQAVAQLQHPNIVQIFEVGPSDDCPYFALEFVDGPNLASALDGRPMATSDAAALVHTLAGAVHHAHQRGIVHRDLKPSNILIAEGGYRYPSATRHQLPAIKITDFGLAKHLANGEGLTLSGQALGTPSYMAPEQATGDRKRMGPLTDVYALGAILYELLTGRPPFRGETPWNTLAAVVMEEVVPPRRLRPEVPVTLENICLKALAKEPERRYPSAADLADDLHRFLRGAAVRARPEGWLSRRVRGVRRHPLRVGLALFALVVVAALAGLSRRENTRLLDQAALALDEGRQRLESREYDEALRTLGRGRESAQQSSDGADVVQAIEVQLLRARRGLAGRELHELAEQSRFSFDPDSLPAGQRQTLAGHCRKVWDVRGRLLDRKGAPLDTATEQVIQDDLLDVALLWTDLTTRNPADAAAQREALAVLREAEAFVGPGPVLARQRQRFAAALGDHELASRAARQAEELAPRSSWEHYALGRSLLRAGQVDAAAAALDRAVAEQPKGFWPHFYRGRCAVQRGKYQEAVEAFNLCVYQAPEAAACYHNRAVALAALGRDPEALRDYDKSLRLDSRLAAAALNRGLLHGRRQEYVPAVTDLERALELGADPGTVYYNLAVVHERGHNREAARIAVEHALHHAPDHPEARELARRLK